MTEEIDPAVLASRQQALAEWMNAAEDPEDRAEVVHGDLVDGWYSYSIEEFMVFGSPGGYTNRLYLVGDGVVYPFSLSTESVEHAVESARAERDGLEPPEPEGPAITQDEWNDSLSR